ncbi:MAG: cytochrome-c peroxidase [Brumimicrobium sp.]
MKKNNFTSTKSYIGLFIFALLSLGLYTSCNSATEKTEEISEETSVHEHEREAELLEKSHLFFQSSVTALIDTDIPQEKVELGKKLFFDTRLSLDGNISCNSCHNLETHGVDNLPLSPGDTDEFGGRNSPTVLYAFLHGMQFWDGRAKDVEEQAGGPILNPVEHNIPNAEFLEERLRGVEEYQEMFGRVYKDSAEAITFATITDAIGAFERQLAPVSRFDEWMDGKTDALTKEEKDGLALFFDNQCTTCHNGPALGGRMLQKFGLYGDYWVHTKSEKIDLGRYEETKEERDKHFFKVPGLRNVAETYPYFHDGSVEKLEDAIRIMGELQIQDDLTEEEVQSITTFLKSLTGELDEDLKRMN